MTEDAKKKSGRKKQASPPYLQTEQLVRTALNQGMSAKDIAGMCRVDPSAINGWKNGRVKAPTHVIEPLIEMFGYSVNRHQLHHFCYYDQKTKIEKIVEVRGSLIYSWDFKEVYDIDERSISSKRSYLNLSFPKLKDVVMSKIYLYYQKPNKFIVLIARPIVDVSTIQNIPDYDTQHLKLHISEKLPDTFTITKFDNANEAINCIYEYLKSILELSHIISNSSDRVLDYQRYIKINEKYYLYMNGSISDTKLLMEAIGLFYLKQYRNGRCQHSCNDGLLLSR